jgi:DNA polymerase III subunit chi
MTDVWFYHLERQPLENVLPRILAGMYARGDRVCVHAPDMKFLEDMSLRLWKFEDTAFVPNGLEGEHQPILFSTGEDAANGARYRFYLNAELPADLTPIARAAVFFDGNSEANVGKARTLWKRLRGEGHAIKYWKQSESGRWEDQAQRQAA